MLSAMRRYVDFLVFLLMMLLVCWVMKMILSLKEMARRTT